MHTYPLTTSGDTHCPASTIHTTSRESASSRGDKVACVITRYERECVGPASNANLHGELIVYSFGVRSDPSFEASFATAYQRPHLRYGNSVNAWARKIWDPVNMLQQGSH